ncbi:MAG TPA: asparagine synthase-related protein [Solirubrobacteraceae bacterium]|nr:asparagine synthase-related protein [Solirubrobacteraceae bacterium]
MTGESLTSLEIASGIVLPVVRRGSRPPDPSGAGKYRRRAPLGNSTAPRDALEREILPCLLRAPCLVSFSGGRDSAAVLATATMLARREGLPDPIPATNVFPSVQDADESEWQELLVRRLGLSDWLRVEHEQELDLIGPYAQRVLTDHGLLWPANAHFHVPLLEEARGGSMLTGLGGDELYLAARRLHSAAVLSRAVRARPRDALSLGFAFAPRSLRKVVIFRRSKIPASWLREAARKRVTKLLAAEEAAEPRGLAERLLWWRGVRYLQVAVRSLDLIAGDTSTRVVHPLLSPPFWTAVGTVAPTAGFASRTDGVRSLFGDLLPPAIIDRTSKANFGAIFWTDHAREFARGWDGSGVPEEWVDARELGRHWSSDRPCLPSSTLLQAAWLASAGHGSEQTLERVLD